METLAGSRSRRKQILKKRDETESFSSSSPICMSSSQESSCSGSSSSSGYLSSQEPLLSKKEIPKTSAKTRGKESFRLPADRPYDKQREKNNEAVRRSREKAKKHLLEVQNMIAELTEQNQKLEQNADRLRKEATLIRAMYSAHIRTGHGLILSDQDLICPDDLTAAHALKQITIHNDKQEA